MLVISNWYCLYLHIHKVDYDAKMATKDNSNTADAGNFLVNQKAPEVKS